MICVSFTECERCERLLFPGDEFYRDSDFNDFCEDCIEPSVPFCYT